MMHKTKIQYLLDRVDIYSFQENTNKSLRYLCKSLSGFLFRAIIYKKGVVDVDLSSQHTRDTNTQIQMITAEIKKNMCCFNDSSKNLCN